MSLPFFKTKKDAQRLWGKKEKLVRVYVPESRGFLQAPKSGYYWVTQGMKTGLKLKKSAK